jgi:hypothetical protein
LEASTQAARGLQPSGDEIAVDDFFDAFRGRNFSVYDAKTGQTVSPKYWEKWSQNRDLTKTAEQLLNFGDGVCGQWADLFMKMLHAQGIDPVAKTDGIHDVTSVNFGKGEAFLISGQWPALQNKLTTPITLEKTKYDWAIERGAQNANLVPQFMYAAGTNGNYWADFNGTTKMGANKAKNNALADYSWRAGNSGRIAQNSINPRPIFADHAIVQWGEKIYDPSYGNAFENRDTFVTGSIAAFIRPETEALAKLPRELQKMYAPAAVVNAAGIPEVSLWLLRKPRDRHDLNWGDK